MPLQIRRGTQADREDLVTSYVPLTVGEPLFTTDEGNLYVGDGITPGGVHVNAPQIFDFGTYEGQIGEIEKQPITQPGIKSPFITLDGIAVTIDLDGQISSNVVPNFNELFDLGSDNFRFRKLWISGNGIQVGEALLFNDGTTLTLPFGSTVNGQPIATGQGINPGDLYVISIGSDDSTVVLDHTTGVLTGTLRGDVTQLGGDVVIDAEAKSATLEEINLEGIAVITGNPVFVSDLATFVSGTPSLTEPTVSVAVVSSLSNVGGALSLTRARGTLGGGEAIIATGDEVGALEYAAFDGTSFVSVGSIIATAEGTVTSGQPAPIKLDVNISNGTIIDTVATFKPTRVEFAVAPVMPSLTTTERNALTPAVGMMIYNTTDNKFQGYQNTSGTTLEWVNLS
jgi:hypothetical protein